MTIQLSVLVWTIICFGLLMLILHHLLFQPVLKVMDDRKVRIQNAAKKKAEYEKLEHQHTAALLEREAAVRNAQKKQLKETLEAIRADSRKAEAAAKDRRLREAEACRAKADEEFAEILTVLSAHKTELAAVFADSVTKE